jgi:hypothetical protein
MNSFLDGIANEYRTMLEQSGEPVPSKLDLLFCLRIIINIGSSGRNLPSRIPI